MDLVEIPREEKAKEIVPNEVEIRLSFYVYNLSRLVGKPTMWFPTRSDTNRAVQAQKQARSLKFRS